MNTEEIYQRLQQRFEHGVVSAQLEAIDPWIVVQADSIADVCEFLRDDPALKFNFCNCITAVDYLHTDAKKAAKAEWEPHLELVYHLSSIPLKHSVVLKAMLPRWKDGTEGQLPEAPSVSHLWRTADWHEREVFDLSGVWFRGHRDLRRILCPEDWEGYPLRKDYEMPLEYHGIRGR